MIATNNMLELPCLCLLLLIAISVDSYTLKNYRTEPSFHQRSTQLFARKHHARWGNFIDAIPRPANTKMDALYTRLSLKEKSGVASVQTGDDLRKTRTRDLKEAVLERPVEAELEMYPKFIPQRKWNTEEINVAIECLNLSYGKKTREELDQSQRLGVIDWEAFDVHGSVHIPDYESIQKRKKVYNWIKYHIKKRDIAFEFDTWKWAPRPMVEKMK